MAGQNKVTLTFAGDDAALNRTLKDVQRNAAQTSASLSHAGAGAADLSHNLKDVSTQAKSTKTLLHGAGEAADLFGGSLGNVAITAAMGLGAVKDMAKGVAGLSKEMTLAKAASAVLVGGIAALAVAVGLSGAKQGEANNAVKLGADLNYYASAAVSTLTAKLPGLGGWTDKWRDKADAASRAAHGWTVETYNLVAALRTLDNQKRAQGTYGIPDQNPGGDGFVDQSALDSMELDPAKLYAQYNAGAIKSAASASRSAAKDAAAAAKARAAELKRAAEEAARLLQQAKKTVADAVRGLAEAFAPKFDLDTGSSDGYSRVGDTMGGAPGGLIANLKKQARDTIKLRKDIERLAKMGLDPALLKNLAEGGLASLPAAEDLLHGGKSEIGLANKYSRQINSNANTIAAEQTARSLTKKDKQQLDINVKGGDAELVKLVRKWVKSNGGNVQSVLGA